MEEQGHGNSGGPAGSTRLPESQEGGGKQAALVGHFN